MGTYNVVGTLLGIGDSSKQNKVPAPTESTFWWWGRSINKQIIYTLGGSKCCKEN